jgi:type II secretory pathway component GspD/PulD (secretin)
MCARISILVMSCCLFLSTPTFVWANEKPIVTLEVRLISMSEEFFDKCGQLNLKGESVFATAPDEKPCPRDQVPFVLKAEGSNFVDPILGILDLNERQFGRILHIAANDKRTNILQAPTLKVDDSKPGRLDLTDQVFLVTAVSVKRTPNGNVVFAHKAESFNLGFQMEFEPKLSPAGDSIQLSTKIKQKELVATRVGVVEDPTTGKPVVPNKHLQQPQFGTLHFEKTFSVPNGHTVAIGGCKRMIEARHEFGPPILSRIPYVNRLFKNVGYGREVQSVLILITPRLLHQNPPIGS